MAKFLFLGFNMLMTAGIVQGFVLSFLLLRSRKGNKGANRFLALLIAVFSVSLGFSMFTYFPVYGDATEMTRLGEPTLFLLGPMVHLYAKEMMGESRPLRVDLLHFLPFISYFAFVLIMSRETVLLGAQAGVFYFINLVVWIFLIIHNGGYTVIANRLLDRNREEVKAHASTLSGVDLGWVRGFMNTAAAFLVLFVAVIFIGLQGRVTSVMQMLISFLLSVFVFGLGYGALQQREIDRPKPPRVRWPVDRTSAEVPVGVESGNLGREEAERIRNEAKHFLEESRLYSDPDLDATMLADRIELDPERLMNGIRMAEGLRFFEFANAMRIDAFRKLLTGTSDAPARIALRVGFLSFSAFRETFHLMTGKSSRRYIAVVRRARKTAKPVVEERRS